MIAVPKGTDSHSEAKVLLGHPLAVLRQSSGQRHELLAPSMTDAEFSTFVELAAKWTGVLLAPNKRAMLLARLGNRLRQLKLPSIDVYLRYLMSAQGQAEEREHFIDVVTTHHTAFFREQEHFSVLATDVLKSFARNSKISVLSAACSTGEEVWSIGMTLGESLGHLNFQLEGTDISQRALHTARHAVYPEESIKGIPEKTASKWFMRSRERNHRLVRVVPELRERASFTLVNLTSPNASALKRYDVVFLRNVLIYFNREAQRRILSRVLSHLTLRGWLFVGLSETAEGLDLPIERVAHSIYRRVA